MPPLSSHITCYYRFLVRQCIRFVQGIRSSGRLLWLSLLLTWRCSPFLMLLLLLILFMQTFLPTLSLFLYRLVLDRAAIVAGYPITHDAFALQASLVIWITGAAVCVVLNQFLQLVTATLQNVIGDRLTVYITEQVIRASNRWQGLARFEDPSFADDLQRTRTHASRAGIDIMTHGAIVAGDLFTIVSMLLILGRLHPLIPSLILLTALPSLAQWWRYVSSTAKIIYQQTPDARRLEYFRNMLLIEETAKDVRHYNLGSFFRQRYNTLFTLTMQTLSENRRRLTWNMLLTLVLSASAIGLIFLYIVWLVIQGSLSIGDLVLYGGAIALLQQALREGGIMGGQLPEILSFLPCIFRVLEAPPDLPQSAHPCAVPHPIREGIIFEHVSFTYPGQDVPVLHDVSFYLAPGECIALVGRNGTGKTTIVKLLLRLYDPTNGRILLDGSDLRDYDLDELRQEFGAIFQDFVHYDLTVRENIGVGQIRALHDTEQLLHAARLANADTLLADLPQGLETPLGQSFGGQNLSGGQWQKLALARAFVRDCQILILDEPTAALDVQTEYAMYTRFHDLTRGHMTLLISHRLSTVRMANRILYLADGCIQEEGSHDELLSCGGAYAQLYQLQSAQYLSVEEQREEQQLEEQQ